MKKRVVKAQVQPVVIPLAETDKDALHYMPNGWFYWQDVDYMVRRPQYRCRRLAKIGVLKVRYNSACVPEYQKV